MPRQQGALATDGQGREVARQARAVGITAKVFQERGLQGPDAVIPIALEAIRQGKTIRIVEVVKRSVLEYPNWVRKHLTPGLEAPTLRDPGETGIWLDLRQPTSNRPTGHEVYAGLRAVDLLGRSLSFGDLKWYEANPNCIPADWRGKVVYGWASVVRDDEDELHVPYMDCGVKQPSVSWRWLNDRWNYREPAGLRR
ncbi:MAG: hypothetical protein NUW02_02810 [Candidatus Campbellbacteria bacterium]|nr:hypothetical protein [Candidatus Campbellbacteria bacterium]